jgi:hypothetical protein
MNLDLIPLPWDAATIARLTEIVAFKAEYAETNIVHLDLRLADGRLVRPFAFQDITYVRCLSQVMAFRNVNYAGVYEDDIRTGLFVSSRVCPAKGAAVLAPRKIAVAYQYREKLDRSIEFFLCGSPGLSWHWVRQPLQDRLQMMIQAMNSGNQFQVTFEPDQSGEAKDVCVEWVNRK